MIINFNEIKKLIWWISVLLISSFISSTYIWLENSERERERRPLKLPTGVKLKFNLQGLGKFLLECDNEDPKWRMGATMSLSGTTLLGRFLSGKGT